MDGSLTITKESNVSNPIWINGHRIASGHPINLNPGDVLVFGSINFSYLVDIPDFDEDDETYEGKDWQDMIERRRTMSSATSNAEVESCIFSEFKTLL